MKDLTKIEKRQDYNLALVHTLERLVQLHPELRFGQILLQFGFVEKTSTGSWQDDFYLESVDLHSRVIDKLIVKVEPKE